MLNDLDLTWVTQSSGALRIGRVVRAVASLAFVGALTVVIATLVAGRSTHWAHWLLLPGIPVLIAGQLWAVAVQMGRLRVLMASGRPRKWWQGRFSQGDVRRALFGGLPTWQTGLFFAAEIAAGVTATVSEPDSHWFPSPQRFAAAAFMGFYAAHAAVSSAELARREAEQFARDRGYPPPT
jgi:hypothetical protein